MTVVLVILCLALVVYLLLQKQQVRTMNRILEKRIQENTRQMVSIELLSKGMNRLADNINRSLKKEEDLKIQMFEEEKHFKEMIANISHDLRTPLTSVKGYIQLLEQTELDEEQKTKLAVAKKHAGELGILIEHFFEYTYLLDSELDVRPIPIRLLDLTAEYIASLVASIEEAQLSVTMENSNAVILADREMTGRIIQNLLRNCISHAEGEISIWIDEGSSANCANYINNTYNINNSYWILHMKNPIKKDVTIDAARLFERFYSADRVSHSSGLGLSIVKLLAEKMGGFVSAEVQEGQLDIRVAFLKN